MLQPPDKLPEPRPASSSAMREGDVLPYDDNNHTHTHHRRHSSKVSSSSGGHNHTEPPRHDPPPPSHTSRPLPSLLVKACRNMHPPSFKQLLTTCIVLTVCLFLYSRRLWAVPTSQTHDEWAKPPPIQQGQKPTDPTIPTPPDAEKVEHQTPFQQIPYHWNDYQP